MATTQDAVQQQRPRRRSRGFFARLMSSRWMQSPWFWGIISALVVFGIWNRWQFSFAHAFKEIAIDIYQLNKGAEVSAIIQSAPVAALSLVVVLLVVTAGSAWYALKLIRRGEFTGLTRPVVLVMATVAIEVIFAKIYGVLEATWAQAFLLAIIVMVILALVAIGSWMAGIAINSLSAGHFWISVGAVILGVILFAALPAAVEWWFRPSMDNISFYVQLVLVVWMTFGFRAKKIELMATGYRTVGSSSNITVDNFGEDAVRDLEEAHGDMHNDGDDGFLGLGGGHDDLDELDHDSHPALDHDDFDDDRR